MKPLTVALLALISCVPAFPEVPWGASNEGDLTVVLLQQRTPPIAIANPKPANSEGVILTLEAPKAEPGTVFRITIVIRLESGEVVISDNKTITYDPKIINSTWFPVGTPSEVVALQVVQETKYSFGNRQKPTS